LIGEDSDVFAVIWCSSHAIWCIHNWQKRSRSTKKTID